MLGDRKCAFRRCPLYAATPESILIGDLMPGGLLTVHPSASDIREIARPERGFPHLQL
jgi:hypothetical protein